MQKHTHSTPKQTILKQQFKNALLLAPSVIYSPQVSMSRGFFLHSRLIFSAANYNVHQVAPSMSAAMTNKTLETYYSRTHKQHLEVNLNKLEESAWGICYGKAKDKDKWYTCECIYYAATLVKAITFASLTSVDMPATKSLHYSHNILATS